VEHGADDRREDDEGDDYAAHVLRPRPDCGAERLP
jgi:hypothetical protein